MIVAHLLSRPLRIPVGRLVDAARRWPVESQLAARRNAMVACTDLAQRRAEHEEVEEYLTARRRAPVPGSAAPGARG
jgi:hypothetical protein